MLLRRLHSLAARMDNALRAPFGDENHPISGRLGWLLRHASCFWRPELIPWKTAQHVSARIGAIASRPRAKLQAQAPTPSPARGQRENETRGETRGTGLLRPALQRLYRRVPADELAVPQRPRRAAPARRHGNRCGVAQPQTAARASRHGSRDVLFPGENGGDERERGCRPPRRDRDGGVQAQAKRSGPARLLARPRAVLLRLQLRGRFAHGRVRSAVHLLLARRYSPREGSQRRRVLSQRGRA